EVVDGQEPVLVQELRMAAVDDRLPREGSADPARRLLEVDEPLPPGELEVEHARWAAPERAVSHGERHRRIPTRAAPQRTRGAASDDRPRQLDERRRDAPPDRRAVPDERERAVDFRAAGRAVDL